MARDPELLAGIMAIYAAIATQATEAAEAEKLALEVAQFDGQSDGNE